MAAAAEAPPDVERSEVGSKGRYGWYQDNQEIVMHLEYGLSAKTCPPDSNMVALHPHRTTWVLTGWGLEKHSELYCVLSKNRRYQESAAISLRRYAGPTIAS